MPSTSILFAQTPDTAPTGQPEPAFFVDLNLDQIVAGVTAGRADFDLKEFYRAPLDSTQAIQYRQQVFQDLERADLRDRMGDFADTMTRVRHRLAQAADLHYPYQRERWHLDAAATYCDAIESLAADLGHADLRSPGLMRFREFLNDYAAGEAFGVLSDDTDRCGAGLAGIQYCLQISGN